MNVAVGSAFDRSSVRKARHRLYLELGPVDADDEEPIIHIPVPRETITER
jgi:hypothetical protein